MKKLIFLIMITLTLCVASSPFCAGFEAGYKAGYCHGKYSCLAPLSPLCPLPGLGEESYMDGYNRGFLIGLNAQ